MSIKHIVQEAAKQRPGFDQAIGLASNTDVSAVAPMLHPLYESVAGTPATTEDQTLFDLIPGYWLIHVSQLAEEKNHLSSLFQGGVSPFIPFLADSTRCFVAVCEEDSGVYQVTPDGIEKLSESLNGYLETVYQFYIQGAYSLDEEGYLDYDFEKEGEIGAALNPTCAYWE